MLTHQTDAVRQPIAYGPTSGVDDTQRLAESDGVLSKPRLRGWIHLYCAFAALIAGSALVAVLRRGVEPATAVPPARGARRGYASPFSRDLSPCPFGIRGRLRICMRRGDPLDALFVVIAVTYIPLASPDMSPSTGYVALAIVWGGALAGIALTLFWPDAPRWLGVALYLLLGWVAVWYTGKPCITPAWPRRYYSLLAAYFTASVRSSTHSARPVAVDVRLSRDISRVYRARCDLSDCGGLHRGVVRQALSQRPPRKLALPCVRRILAPLGAGVVESAAADRVSCGDTCRRARFRADSIEPAVEKGVSLFGVLGDVLARRLGRAPLIAALYGYVAPSSDPRVVMEVVSEKWCAHGRTSGSRSITSCRRANASQAARSLMCRHWCGSEELPAARFPTAVRPPRPLRTLLMRSKVPPSQPASAATGRQDLTGATAGGDRIAHLVGPSQCDSDDRDH